MYKYRSERRRFAISYVNFDVYFPVDCAKQNSIPKLP